MKSGKNFCDYITSYNFPTERRHLEALIKGLRDYQANAIRDVYKWLSQNQGNPCIVAPTGSGKAWICAG
ncbi:MAG: DEAD/DEAH box helicase family protein, partial [Synergistaceae bacterium]|nr:DEAD/DEAH box helicase family protein [Synergistaceae bacterium]